ncbi:hypothetical protein BAZMOX_00523_0 [methanotrophic endosymbiont of Bathymodiolus azoricus (Menez Gwen)]|jgi:hypothetical protein|nr:hypothetical protein BAZMOX_00523_0 [methanotrophic endosymbiont of Bathymodiolus azoricus (Menez Gwen)]
MKNLKVTIALLATMAITPSYAEIIEIDEYTELETDTVLVNAGLVVIKDKEGGILCINNINSEIDLHDGEVYIIRGQWTETLYRGVMTDADTNPVLELTQQFETHDDMDGDKIYTGEITYVGIYGDETELNYIWARGTMGSTCKINVNKR